MTIVIGRLATRAGTPMPSRDWESGLHAHSVQVIQVMRIVHVTNGVSGSEGLQAPEINPLLSNLKSQTLRPKPDPVNSPPAVRSNSGESLP